MAIAGCSPEIVKIICKPMPTAIVRAHTPDGFVIAADGRAINVTTGQVLSDTRQKIFQVGKTPIAYCATGCDLLGDHGDTLDNILFNFNAQLKNRTKDASLADIQSLLDFVKILSESIYEDLKHACRGGKVDMPHGISDGGNDGETILTVFFDGYVDGNPERVISRFYHEDEIPKRPQIYRDNLFEVCRYGSAIVASEMMTFDSKFRQYYETLPSLSLPESQYLSHEIQAAANYIRACSSSDARSIDPKCCKSIGGRIHIARITPRVGFKWVHGLLPLFNQEWQGDRR